MDGLRALLFFFNIFLLLILMLGYSVFVQFQSFVWFLGENEGKVMNIKFGVLVNRRVVLG